jgi:hypothetical protein
VMPLAPTTTPSACRPSQCSPVGRTTGRGRAWYRRRRKRARGRLGAGHWRSRRETGRRGGSSSAPRRGRPCVPGRGGLSPAGRGCNRDPRPIQETGWSKKPPPPPLAAGPTGSKVATPLEECGSWTAKPSASKAIRAKNTPSLTPRVGASPSGWAWRSANRPGFARTAGSPHRRTKTGSADIARPGQLADLFRSGPAERHTAARTVSA